MQFGSVLDGEDPLSIVDEGGKCVERGGFARAGAPRDDDVEAGGDGGLKIGGHFLGKGPEFHQIVDAQLVLLEFPDGNQAAIHRDGGHHGIEARAIGKAGVDIGVGFVHAPTHRRHDLVDDTQEMLFILEGDVAEFELARAFDKDLVRAIDENIVDRVILEQGFKRTEALDLVIEFLGELRTVLAVEDDAFFFENLAGNRADFGPQVGFGGRIERGQIEVIEHCAVQFDLDLADPLFALAFLVHAHRHCRNLLRGFAEGGEGGGLDRGGSRERHRRCGGFWSGPVVGGFLVTREHLVLPLVRRLRRRSCQEHARSWPIWRFRGAADSWRNWRPAAGHDPSSGRPPARHPAREVRCGFPSSRPCV